MTHTQLDKKKIYYTMGEVSEMFDVNPSLIRFWEQKFDILKPDKNRKGNRLFSPKDVENLKLIYHLVKENKMTLAGAQERIRKNRDGLEHDLQIIERLQGIRALLMEVRAGLDHDPSEHTIVISESDLSPLESPVEPLSGAPTAELESQPTLNEKSNKEQVNTPQGVQSILLAPPILESQIIAELEQKQRAEAEQKQRAEAEQKQRAEAEQIAEELLKTKKQLEAEAEEPLEARADGALFAVPALRSEPETESASATASTSETETLASEGEPTNSAAPATPKAEVQERLEAEEPIAPARPQIIEQTLF